MYKRIFSARKHVGAWMLSAVSLLAVNAALAQEKQPDENLSAWLGQEFTVNTSSRNEYMPDQGKLTFTYDAGKDAVHVCARNADGQEGRWKMDLSKPCGVTMAFTRGTKYCTAEDVKAGNAEVLATCHRLRSRDVALRPSQTKGAVELNDMVAFLLQESDGTKSMAILVDSPSRPTDGTVIIVRTRR